MRIVPVSYSQNCYKPSFTDYSVYSTTGEYDYYTTTKFFRGDIEWIKLVNFMHSKYKDAPKVNIICHACSDGSEPYTLAMLLHSEFGKDADKFFPITAKDIDRINIALAKNGMYFLNQKELNLLRIYVDCDCADKYCDVKQNTHPLQTVLKDNYISKYLIDNWYFMSNEYAASMKIKEDLMNKVNFSYGDILEDINKMPEKNTVLFCRNFWPYLPRDKRVKLAEKIAQKFDSSSLVILGSYDISTIGTDKLLLERGFDRTPVECVFQKKQLHNNAIPCDNSLKVHLMNLRHI